MKRHALIVALLCLPSLWMATSKLNALTIPASEDSYTAPRNTLSYSTNNANSLIVDATRKSYLYFDLSDIPQDAVVRWAKLRLFLPTVRTPGAGLSVHLVTGTWNESTRLADVPSILAGSLGMIAPEKMASRRFVTLDVKDAVQKWINGGTLNEGFAIQPIVKAGSPTASVMLTSKEGPVFGLPAELDIEFGPTFDTLPLSIRSYFGPTITAQPSAPVSGSGDSLSVSASGMGALTYQWMHNGVPIAGATGSQLPSVGLQSGTYTVVVSNEFTSVTSGSVQLIAPITPLEPAGFALVSGGTLPASSELGALPVDTFYIGRTEVTWGEWKAVRTWAVANGYTDLANVGTGIADTYPVSDVNWYDVVKWCNARSEKEGKTPVYKNGTNVYRNGNVSEPAIVASANGYRLPSEKEWEFAARGGTQTNGYTYSGSNDLSEVGWYRANYGSLENSDSVHEVGKKLANELGIYDMSGNLWEWCASWHPSYVGVSRIIRGGFWHWHDGYAEFCTVAYRGNRNPETRNGYDGGGKSFGFRVAINATPQMVLIPGGQFEMGDPLDNDLDAPVHTVNLSPFYMGEAEVTYREWTAVKGWAQNHGYSFSHQGWGQNDLDPVICGNFYDVLKWINAKSELDGLIPCYYKDDGLISVYRSGEIDINNSKVNWSASGYRLPTEAEWERAARGGKIGKRYPWGDSINTSLANYSESERYVSIELGQTSVYRSVKSYPPNDYGLYDMTGNAWEWCWDRYGSYGASELANPKGPDVGDQRVVRGGDWDSSPQLCRVARRSKCLLNYDLYNHGFRLVKQ